MAGNTPPPGPLKKPSELLFFDNLALYYLMERTPPKVLARVLNAGESRLAGSLLGIMNPKQRKVIHQLMSSEKDDDADANQQAVDALIIIANDLFARGFLRKSGPHYYGVPREEQLRPQEGAAH